MVYQKRMKSWQGIIFGFVFVLIGAFLLWFFLHTIQVYKEKDRTFIETYAKVVDYDLNEEGLMAIVAQYSVGGKKYRIKSNTYLSHPKNKGTLVAIKYNPDNPEDFIWKNDSTNFIFPIVGSIFLLVGGIIDYFAIRNVIKKVEYM